MPNSEMAAASLQYESEILELRMGNGTPFTYSSLIEERFAQCGKRDDDRLIDKTIQKWRRKGWIAFERQGRKVIWRLTPVGRAQKPSHQPF